jgi:phage FluMu protein Com
MTNEKLRSMGLNLTPKPAEDLPLHPMDANTQKKVTLKFFCTHCGDPLTGQSGSEVACSSCGTSNSLPSADEHPSQILPSEHEEISNFYCTYCHQKLSSPVGFAGKEFECPTCSKTNVVPGEKPHLSSPRPYERLLKFFCSSCGQKLSCEPELQGKTIDCPVCFEPTKTSPSSKDHPTPRLIVKKPASFPKNPPPPVEDPPAEAEETPATSPTPLKPKLQVRPPTYRKKVSDLPDFELQPVEHTKATEKLEQMLLLDESLKNPDQADLKAERDARAKTETDSKKKLTSERTRESVKKKGKESASEKTSATRKLLTPPKSVNAPTALPSSIDQIETEAQQVPTTKEKTLRTLFGLLKRNQPLDKTTNGTANSAKGLQTDLPKASASQGSSSPEESALPKSAPAPHLRRLTSLASDGAPSTAKSPSRTQKRPVKKSSPSKTTGPKTRLPSSSGPIDKTKAAPSGKKKSAPRKAQSAPPRSTKFTPIKPKKNTPMGRRQLPKNPTSPNEESPPSTRTLSKSNPASSLESASSLSDTQPIRLTNPINGKNRTILPQPRDEQEDIVNGPIRLGETESTLPAPRVKQPTFMENKVAEALADPDLEDDPFNVLLDEAFDVEKLFPRVESSLSTAKRKK